MNTRLTTLCAALLAAGLAPLTAQAVTAPTIADTNTSASNAGSLPMVVVSPTATGLVKFDLSGLPDGTQGTDIAKATLVFFVKSATATGNVQVAPVATGSSWSEASAVASVSTGAATSSVSVTQGSAFYTLDVTSAVQDWVDTPANNLGLALTPQTTASITFDSKENTLTSHPAYLEISLNSGGLTSISDSTPTSLTGMLKGDGANISVATPGTDYLAPGSNLDAGNIATGAVTITHGGTGATNVADARSNLGLGGLAMLSAVGSTEITDGSITDSDVSSISTAKITGLGTVATLSTNGSTTQFLRGDGTFATPSGGGAAVYDSSGNAAAGAKIVIGTITGIPTSGSKSASFTNSAVFTSAPSCVVTVISGSGGNATTAKVSSTTSSVTAYNSNTTTTMDVNYQCIGN